jgi:hypothetical protein
MSYFIFLKNLDNIEATLYKIAENEFDLNNLNIHKDDYKIIEDTQINFDLFKYGNKSIVKYNNNIVSYLDKIIDTDGDGEVSETELAQAIAVLEKARKEKIKKEQQGAFMKFDFKKFDYDEKS